MECSCNKQCVDAEDGAVVPVYVEYLRVATLAWVSRLIFTSSPGPASICWGSVVSPDTQPTHATLGIKCKLFSSLLKLLVVTLYEMITQNRLWENFYALHVWLCYRALIKENDYVLFTSSIQDLCMFHQCQYCICTVICFCPVWHRIKASGRRLN